MSKNFLVIKSSCLILILFACTQPSETQIISEISLSALPTITTPLPKLEIQEQCLDILNSSFLKLSGQLILSDFIEDYSPYLYNLSTKAIEPLQTISFSVSPDRTKIAYLFQSGSKDGELQLLIKSVNSNDEISIAWQKNWLSLRKWLDNDRLLIDVKVERNGIKTGTVVLSIYNGDITEIIPDYPEIDSVSYSHWNLSYAVYNPQLSKVLYPSYAGNPRATVLWDLEKKQEITQIQSATFQSPEPVWLSNGENAIVIGSLTKTRISAYNDYWYNEEIFLLSEEGELNRLTYLTDFYNLVQIGNFSVSPDEKIIAFWLFSTNSQQNDGIIGTYKLAILNVSNKEIINYCIEYNGAGAPRMPIWSPNGKYLIIQDSNNQYNKVLIADIQNAKAYQFFEKVLVYDWLVTE